MAVTKLGALPTGVNTPVSITIAGTGVTSYATFSVQAAPNGHDRTLVLSVTDPTALPTTLTVDLEASPDGGTTWGKYATSVALVATAALTFAIVKNVVAGILYRIDPTTFSAGSSTGVVVQGCMN